jgi:5-methylcytosine-specific restriction endonuclease McrA
MLETLVLNATYEVMKIVSWKQAIKLYFREKVDIVEEYDHNVLTPTLIMRIPAVVKYRQVINLKRYINVKFGRISVYTRDNFTCQYCHHKFLKARLTLDHVMPKSRGGTSSWINCVTCCKECNVRKADRTPKEANMKLYKEPCQPNQTEAFVLAATTNTNLMPEAWKNYSWPDTK